MYSREYTVRIVLRIIFARASLIIGSGCSYVRRIPHTYENKSGTPYSMLFLTSWFFFEGCTRNCKKVIRTSGGENVRTILNISIVFVNTSTIHPGSFFIRYMYCSRARQLQYIYTVYILYIFICVCTAVQYQENLWNISGGERESSWRQSTTASFLIPEYSFPPQKSHKKATYQLGCATHYSGSQYSSDW
jgi:hypothetical protein